MTKTTLGLAFLAGAPLLWGCTENSGWQSQCLEHRPTEFGNQTYWDSCPAHKPVSPWRGASGGR
jgi:hypothetical protein